MPKAYYIDEDGLDDLQKKFTCATLRKINNSSHTTYYAMTYKEIAAVLGISYQSVEQTVRRALRKLRKEYVDIH